MAHLAGFTGVLQVDGFGGLPWPYEWRRGEARLLLEPCLRGFIDLAAKGASPIAAEVLTRMAALYRIEGEARRQAREERSRPLLSALERFKGNKLALLGQKSTLAVAIRYAAPR